jgi:hypothetical protein
MDMAFKLCPPLLIQPTCNPTKERLSLHISHLFQCNSNSHNQIVDPKVTEALKRIILSACRRSLDGQKGLTFYNVYSVGYIPYIKRY